MRLSLAFAVVLSFGVLARPIIHIDVEIDDYRVPSIPQPIKFRQADTFMFKQHSMSNPKHSTAEEEALRIMRLVPPSQDPNKCHPIGEDGNPHRGTGG